MLFKIGDTIKIKPAESTSNEILRLLYEEQQSLGVISGYALSGCYEIIWGVPKVHKRIISYNIIDAYYEMVG